MLKLSEIISLIIKHGQYAAAKWVGYIDERPYWEARYCGLQTLYAEVIGVPDAYGVFNVECGVTFKDGHIAGADERYNNKN